MVNVNLNAKNMSLTSAITDYVRKKVQSLEKYISGTDDTEVQAWVEVGVVSKHHNTGDIFKAELRLKLPQHINKGGGLIAVSEKDDLYAAIDEMREEMKRELTHLKAKRISVFKRGARKLKRIFSQ